MDRRDLPDEANRYDGKPAPRNVPEGHPSPEEVEEGRKQHENAVEFVAELLQAAGVEAVVRQQFPQAEQLNVNVRDLAETQGRLDEYEAYFQYDDRYGQYVILTTVEAAKRLGIETRTEEIDPEGY